MLDHQDLVLCLEVAFLRTLEEVVLELHQSVATVTKLSTVVEDHLEEDHLVEDLQEEDLQVEGHQEVTITVLLWETQLLFLMSLVDLVSMNVTEMVPAR